MTDDTIRIEFETTLEEFAEPHLRQMGRSKLYQRSRRRTLISAGAVYGASGGAIGVIVVAGLLGRPIGVEVLVGAVGGGGLGSLATSLFGWEYDRWMNRQVMTALEELYGARTSSMRCEIELRPTCLWLRQDGLTETAYAWTTITAVEDTPDGVELWFNSLPIVAHSRAFATPSDRERFINRARALLVSVQPPTTQPATTQSAN